MANETRQIGGLGTLAVPLDYAVPNAQEFTLMGVRALFDGTAAAAFLPCVQIFSDSGNLMVETIGSSVAAGGSADASFFPLRRQVGAAQLGTFAQTVLTIATANTLRGYWRLGESAAPMADSSGWSGGPTDLTVSGAGAAPTFHIAGALPFGQDDGAIQLNGGPSTGKYLANGSGAVNTGINTGFSIAAWVNPGVSAAAWAGGVYANFVRTIGPPPLLNGWGLIAGYSGGAVTIRLQRFINDAVVNVTAPVPVGSWTFIVGTYDGATLRIYSNGVLIASAADARADTFDPYFSVDLGFMFNDPLATPGGFLGGLDEVAIWGTVLTLGQIQTLYAASQL